MGIIIFIKMSLVIKNFTKSPLSRISKGSSLGKIVVRHESGTPSTKLMNKDGTIVHMSLDQYTPQGGVAHQGQPLTPSAQRYPKSASVTDLDGMEKSNTNSKALQYGGMIKKHAIPAMDYMGTIRQPHPIWTKEECDNVEITHLKPKGIAPRLAYSLVWTLRRAFDLGTGYSLGLKNERTFVLRVIILETVAGIPGMVGAFIRHMRSLRRGTKDYGWIHSLLEEAENERMHLMIAMSLRDMGFITRSVVCVAQGLVLPFYFLSYLISHKFCHSFVGYLEEEAVKTYTQFLDHMDAGHLPGLHMDAPICAKNYYHLPDGATFRDVITNIRADEAHHRQLNHCLAHMTATEINPFPPGY